jgi:hypothetical protein
MAKEAAAGAAKPKHAKRPPADEDPPKLFMQLGWSEQRKAGTSAPVLRQVEGDSIRQRVRNYRRAIFFHIHGECCYMLLAGRIGCTQPRECSTGSQAGPQRVSAPAAPSQQDEPERQRRESIQLNQACSSPLTPCRH